MSQDDPFAANYFEAPKADLAREYDPSVGEPGPAEITTAAVGQAWKLVQDRWGTWVLISLLMFICTYAVVFAIGLGLIVSTAGVPGPGKTAEPPGWVLVVLQIVNLLTTSFFTAGLFRASIKQVRGERISVGDLFSGASVTITMFFTLILYILAIVIGFFALVVPGLYVIGRLVFALPLAAEGGVGPWKAITQSWEATKGQGWAGFWFISVAGLAASLGAFACGIGIFLTLPIYYVATAVLYRNFFRNGPAIV